MHMTGFYFFIYLIFLDDFWTMPRQQSLMKPLFTPLEKEPTAKMSLIYHSYNWFYNTFIPGINLVLVNFELILIIFLIYNVSIHSAVTYGFF